MHRSSFRAKKQFSAATTAASKSPSELTEIREQIANLSQSLSPLRANVERLAVPKTDISVPKDIARTLGEIQNQLNRLERRQAETEAQTKRMATTFSNAILKLADKVERISGGEDSSFSLAHSLEKLLAVLSSRKLRIIRDSHGDMVGVETTSGTQN
jgi:Mg2+ and Co2+ transporter CorA